MQSDSNTQKDLMTPADIHAFGVEIVCKQLVKDGWDVASAAPVRQDMPFPQIVARKDGETAFVIVRTDVFPNRGRFEGGQSVYNAFVEYALSQGASCYFASVGIANSEAATEAEMSVPVKGVGFNVEFNGIIRMELPGPEADAPTSA